MLQAAKDGVSHTRLHIASEQGDSVPPAIASLGSPVNLNSPPSVVLRGLPHSQAEWPASKPLCGRLMGGSPLQDK